MRVNSRGDKGYTLIELMMVVAIVSIIASIVTPRFDLVFQRAYQSKTRSNLAAIRSALSIYYTETDAQWPLGNYPQGDSYYTDGISLSTILVPKYLANFPTPRLIDRMVTFNGLSQSYDPSAAALMSMSPPKDVYIVWGIPDYTPMLSSPYAYDNRQGAIYIPNGNFDVTNNYFYSW